MTIDARKVTNDTIDAFFENFGAGNLPALLDLFADTVDFNVAGAPNIPWAGRRSGRAEIAEFFGLFGEVLTPAESFAVNGRLVDGADGVVFATCVFGVLATGKKFTNSYALHVTVTDGRIVRYHMYEDSYAIAEAFAA
ncbi:hypothetical protein EDD99_2539 [Streptomyces sp. 846.5]|nr:nuclear transport factor 2 family protein [Streptomyces sp. 846.5]TDU04085.1 hypothetical protein EDD99_2539 [Streptomyces sp. 846.5]